MSAPKKKDYLKKFEKQDGEYVYTGSHYLYSGSDSERKKSYSELIAVLTVLSAMVIASGFITAGGMKNSFYVIIPYIGEVSALFASVWYCVKLFSGGERVRDYVYLSSQPRVHGAFTVLAFFAIAGLLCSLAFSISTGFKEEVLQSVLYLLVKAADAAVALLFRARFSKLEWIEE